MNRFTFLAVPTAAFTELRAGGNDAYGQPAERVVSDGCNNPCRHCLTDIPKGSPMLIAAWRPFGPLQPYAETGPVFFCGDNCERAIESASTPLVVASRTEVLARGYSEDERIVPESGTVVATIELKGRLEALFDDERIAYVHLRSATNNCFQCRVERAG